MEFQMRLGIVGSRDFHDYEKFLRIIACIDRKYNVLQDVVEIVSGGADGVDTLAERFAKDMGLKFKPYHADWKKLGNKAGPIRNTKIVKRIHLIIALPKMTEGQYSRGTRDSINKATKSGKKCYIVVVK
ncbi:MAG: SLOG family protein [Candidatus Roizmanbacteria bacterium]